MLQGAFTAGKACDGSQVNKITTISRLAGRGSELSWGSLCKLKSNKDEELSELIWRDRFHSNADAP